MTCINNSNLNRTFIIDTVDSTASVSACTAMYTNKLVSCDSNTEISLTSGGTIFNTNIIPINDGVLSLGTPNMRFRELNSISGTTSVWFVDSKVVTPTLDLGVDNNNNNRIIDANNSIIQDDILNGGGY